MSRSSKANELDVLGGKRVARVLSRPSVIKTFLNADLRAGHNGLTKVAADYDLDLPNLQENQVVIFVNRKQNLMKAYVPGNTIAFTRRDYIDLNAIEKLPEAFGYKGKFDYDEALKISLEERLGLANRRRDRLQK